MAQVVNAIETAPGVRRDFAGEPEEIECNRRIFHRVESAGDTLAAREIPACQGAARGNLAPHVLDNRQALLHFGVHSVPMAAHHGSPVRHLITGVDH